MFPPINRCFLFGLISITSTTANSIELEGRLRHQDIYQQELGDTDHHALLNRLLLREQWQLEDSTSLLAEGITAYDSSYNNEPSSVERNSADIHRLILSRDFDNTHIMLGRQVWSVDEQRQLGKREGTNVRRRFDGMQLEHQFDETNKLSLFHGYSVNDKAHTFDDNTNSNLAISGVILQQQQLMLHAMRYRDTRDDNNETRYALEGKYRYIQDRNETFFHIIHQLGNNQGKRISAWFCQLKLSHTFADFIFTGTTSYASSDDAGQDALELKAFQPLFAKAPYYSEAGIFSTTNIKHVGIDLQYQWSPKLTLHSSLKRLYRVNKQGNIYSPGHSLMIAADPTRGSRLADTLDFSIQYSLSQNVSIELVSSYVSPNSQFNLNATTFFESMLHYHY
ncbi:alginate export family protein [Shewanella ulleungensis]|uniref:Alginate export domain-containing protein n=1 Tax=Shewanella ulleungensis TaxID=2282699 RepID=A0ABQ2QEE0_9GAMM|nr:alginate export family protein [Shewanella ulleungensis]MCL1148853.1 alginate export family protein [Shewanella ulleungensis]GGP75196.1 hypothetical protein GCM10009410_04090 [Shewanella ulleungensis]